MDISLLSDTDFNQTYVNEHFYLKENIDCFGVTMVILYFFVCVLGLAGNSLVVITMLKLDKMSSSTTVYIFNLALADGLFMVGLPFIASQNFMNQWMFGDVVCKVVMVLDGINQFTSVFCLTVMSIDRYMALADPLRFTRWRTPRCAKIISAFLWLFSLLTILPMALHFSADYGPSGLKHRHQCNRKRANRWSNRAFEFVVLLSYSWSCANPILYACLSHTFKKHFYTLLCPAAKSSPSMQCDTEQHEINDTTAWQVTILA